MFDLHQDQGGAEEVRADVHARFAAENGSDPMTAQDDAYAREHFIGVDSAEGLRMICVGELPLPSFVLSDGTPMIYSGDLASRAPGETASDLREWFAAYWGADQQAGDQAWDDYMSGRFFELRDPTPMRIRHLSRRTAQARTAIELLEADRRDAVGRAMLGEAVDGGAAPGLDDLLLPTSGHEIARLGRLALRDELVDQPRRAFLTPVAPQWPVRTSRLALRPFELADAAAFESAWASEEWTSMLLHPTRNAAEVRDDVGRRAAQRDPRTILLVAEHEGRVVGDVMLRLQGTGLTEAEVGITVLPSEGGRGFATEAVGAAVDLAFDHFGVRRVVALLDARNERSAALCERIGMRREANKAEDFWSKGQWTSSLEYAVLAEEWQVMR